MNSISTTESGTDAGTESDERVLQSQNTRYAWALWVVYALATIHIVWFYVFRVPSFLDLPQFEEGIEQVPFQTRLLMMYPLRWAHDSPLLQGWASRNSTHFWFPSSLLPEDLVGLVVNVAAIAVAGLVATHLYRTHSRLRLLTPYVYPLVLLMVAISYCMPYLNFFRYVYDLPSLGFFAIGCYLIAERSHPFIFALLFVLATINRETSIFLLCFYLASNCVVEERIEWRRLLTWTNGGTAALLGLFWVGWRGWVYQHFAGRHEGGIGTLGNILCFFIPPVWPQLAGVAGYTLLSIVIFRRNIPSTELRLWLRITPIWLAVMTVYGNLFETRVFGELIPIFACMAALIAEERIRLRWKFAEAATT